MRKVVVITDSCAYIPPELVKSLPIRVVPLTLNWEDKTYFDGVDILPDEFYTRLATAKTLPTTSQIPVSTYLDIYAQLLEEEADILTLPISRGLSGTLDSAIQAQKQLNNPRIEVMDTKLVSMALGFQVLTVARAAAEGASLAECKALAIETYSKIGVYFTVDTLKYLAAGGRIGGAKRIFGTALNVKPILEIRDGKIELVESVRTHSKALNQMVKLVEKGINGKKPVRISVFHAGVEDQAKALLERTVKEFDAVEGILSYVSPVIGAHVGPGTLSIAYMAG
ncbi:MAG: DegV family protein [Anaerolineaceae bacterium]|jgi:DegV family protein with EDD domain